MNVVVVLRSHNCSHNYSEKLKSYVSIAGSHSFVKSLAILHVKAPG